MLSLTKASDKNKTQNQAATALSSSVESPAAVAELLPRTQCPHCWHHFAPEDILWISVHESLIGDPVLGENEQLRFPPSRFNAAGLAIDGAGAVCQHLACPRCHLTVPRGLLSVPPTFVSIVGAPGSGKSYLLASMTHSARRTFPQIGVAFNDADTVSNLALSDYEYALFAPTGERKIVSLRKTETTGEDLYHSAIIGEQVFLYPRPFMFSLSPTAKKLTNFRRLLVLYDNAGESFLPGADTGAAPVTHHVAHSSALLFVFDPIRDTNFRKLLKDTTDPQFALNIIYLQNSILNEIAIRIRNLLGLRPNQRHSQPLYILLVKFDIWQHLLPIKKTLPSPFVSDSASPIFNQAAVDKISADARSLLNDVCPDLVATAESTWSTVRYLPISATGCSPQIADGGALGFFAEDLSPINTETPFAQMLADFGDIPR